MTECFKFKEGWQMNWTDTKEKEIDMWKKIFGRSRNYILMKKYKTKGKEESKKKK